MNRFQKSILSGAFLVISIIIVLGVLSKRSVAIFQEDARMVEHTREVMNETEKILTLILNAETAQRGYVITGSEKYLNPFKLSIAQLPGVQQNLRNLISDNPDQKKRVDTLDKYVVEKLDFVSQIISLRKSTDFNTARNAILFADRGEDISQRLRNIINQIQEAENTLLIRRKADVAESSERSSLIFQVATVLVLAIILVLFAYVFVTFQQRMKAEKELSETLEELTQISAENEEKNWVLSGTALLNDTMSGEIAPEELCKNALNVVSDYVNAPMAALYLASENENTLHLVCYKALDKNKVPEKLGFGETYTGEAAVKKKAVYANHGSGLTLNGALLSFDAKAAAFVPLVLNEKTTGVLELVFPEAIEVKTRKFLEIAASSIAVSLNASQAKKHLEELFAQLQVQSEELESQQEELRITNEELNEQTKMLQVSEEELRAQQEELRQSNAELEEKASLLEENNLMIQEARETLIAKTIQLEESNRFKSEFLANMSHELRTPLNSILILARLLSENKGQRLNPDEAKYARVIYNSGNDLLSLINDILDLAKIEAGKVELSPENVALDEIKTDIELLFNQVAAEKNIQFNVSLAGLAYQDIFIDKMRLEQIIRNLLSNAFKFTSENGKVDLEIKQVNDDLLFAVSDNGIGISADKQKVIFEAFQQADGSTSRKFGGTGLGLSISRELAALMNGRIDVKSEERVGSTFTLIIPLKETSAKVEKIKIREVKEAPAEKMVGAPAATNNYLLIIEDDPNFSLILSDFAKARGLEPYLAETGEIGLDMARKLSPLAIILDISLPGMNGWEVLRRLKSRSETASIPVHIISAGEEDRLQMQRFGAIGFVKKPVSAEQLNSIFNPLTSRIPKHYNTILIVEDAPEQNEHLHQLFSDQGYTVAQAFTGEEAKKKLSEDSFDCMVLDMKLPDVDGMDLLDDLKKSGLIENLPVVIHTASDISPADQQRIMEHTSAMVLKTPSSDSRILDEVKLFIHRIKEDHSESKTKKSGEKPGIVLNKTLQGRKILLVDDDMRNIFAMSTALQEYGLEIEIASNGVEALEKLNSSIELVLMDIMMPEMDGYEATRRIRKDNVYKTLPVIALTAKAMKEDRQKALDAGANDYISKPVDVPDLISVISVWLSK